MSPQSVKYTVRCWNSEDL